MRGLSTIFAVICVLTWPMMAVAQDMKAAVQEMNAAWDAAFNAGAVSDIKAMYAEDARVITQDGTVKTGPEEIAGLFQSFVDSGFGDHEIVMETVDGQDGLIYATGAWSGVGGDGKTYGGKVVHVFERQDDGDWKTVLHMWN